MDCPEGQNCCGGNCQDEPCEPCCCINGVIQAAGSYTQETCEACEVIVNCYEFMATTDPCPDGWESVLDGCSRITHPTSCDECSGYSCSSYTVGACGTWYSDCLSATKWSGYVNLTADGYYLDCIGTHFYFGPSGIVYYPTAADEAGFYNSEDDCLAALDDIVADPTTYNPNGCDWPPGLGTGCLPVCIDTNNPLP